MAYVLVDVFGPQIEDVNGVPEANGSIESYVTGTSTPATMYTDSAGTSLGTSCTLNSRGYPQTVGGTEISIFADTAVVYKFVVKDSAGTTLKTIDPFYPDSSANTYFLQSGTGATSRTVQEKLRDIVSVLDFGAVGDGSDESSVVQAAFDSGAKRIDIPAGYVFEVDNIAIPDTVDLVYGGGTLKQRTHDTANITTATSVSNLTIAGVRFVGLNPGNYDLEAFNNAIYLTSCTNVKVHSCSFDDIDNQAVFARTSSRIYVDNNDITGSSAGVRFNGVTRGEITNNILTDCAITDGTFVTAISLNSRVVSGGGPSKSVTISGNQIQGYKNSQGILVHDGNDVKIIGNTVEDSTWGIGCNATDATDEVINIVISGNTIVGSTSVLGSETGEYGIFVGAAVGTTRNITISGNQISGANTVWKSVNEGGIGIGGGSNVHVYGNTCYSCYSNGIVVNQDNVSRVRIHDNIIDTVNTGDSSADRGIAVTSTANTVSGWIKNNTITGATDGVRVTNSQLTSGLYAVENDIEGATTDYVGTTNIVYGYGYIMPYTDADTTPSVKYARTLRVANTGSISITDLDDGVEGQVVEMVFDDANTSIADSAPFRLSAAFTSGQYDSLVVKKQGTQWVELSRSNN